MARISTYSIDPNLGPEDKLHGSDENNVTRNFQLGPGGINGDIINNTFVTYITECDTRALAFLFHDNTFDSNVSPQEGAATNEGALGNLAFSAVTTLLVSKFPYAQALAQATNNHCTDIMGEFVGEKIILYHVDNPNKYGIYQCTGWSQDGTYNDHWNIQLQFKSGNGSLICDPEPLLYIFEPWTGGDKTYTHTQSASSNSWTVPHNLGKFPSVQIETDGGINGYGQVVHNNNNSLTINFSSNYTGKVYCN